jgi:hypothetical protein
MWTFCKELKGNANSEGAIPFRAVRSLSPLGRGGVESTCTGAVVPPTDAGALWQGAMLGLCEFGFVCCRVECDWQLNNNFKA